MAFIQAREKAKKEKEKESESDYQLCNKNRVKLILFIYRHLIELFFA